MNVYDKQKAGVGPSETEACGVDESTKKINEVSRGQVQLTHLDFEILRTPLSFIS